MRIIRQFLILSVPIVALAGCAGGPELLLTPGAAEPPGVDLSGYCGSIRDRVSSDLAVPNV